MRCAIVTWASSGIWGCTIELSIFELAPSGATIVHRLLLRTAGADQVKAKSAVWRTADGARQRRITGMSSGEILRTTIQTIDD